MKIIWNILSALASIVIIAALVPFGAAVITVLTVIVIMGIVSTAVTGRDCLVIERKTTRTREVSKDGETKSRTVITTNRNGKVTTEVVES